MRLVYVFISLILLVLLAHEHGCDASSMSEIKLESEEEARLVEGATKFFIEESQHVFTSTSLTAGDDTKEDLGEVLGASIGGGAPSFTAFDAVQRQVLRKGLTKDLFVSLVKAVGADQLNILTKKLNKCEGRNMVPSSSINEAKLKKIEDFQAEISRRGMNRDLFDSLQKSVLSQRSSIEKQLGNCKGKNKAAKNKASPKASSKPAASPTPSPPKSAASQGGECSCLAGSFQCLIKSEAKTVLGVKMLGSVNNDIKSTGKELSSDASNGKIERPVDDRPPTEASLKLGESSTRKVAFDPDGKGEVCRYVNKLFTSGNWGRGHRGSYVQSVPRWVRTKTSAMIPLSLAGYQKLSRYVQDSPTKSENGCDIDALPQGVCDESNRRCSCTYFQSRNSVLPNVVWGDKLELSNTDICQGSKPPQTLPDPLQWVKDWGEAQKKIKVDPARKCTNFFRKFGARGSPPKGCKGGCYKARGGYYPSTYAAENPCAQSITKCGETSSNTDEIAEMLGAPPPPVASKKVCLDVKQKECFSFTTNCESGLLVLTRR